MSTLDPKARQQLILNVDLALFKKSRNSIENLLVNIIAENSEISGNAQEVMTYRGELYSLRATKMTKEDLHKTVRGRINRCHSALNARMKEYLVQREDLDTSRDFAISYISAIMVKTDYREDYYALLPSQLHVAFDKVAHYFVSPGHAFNEEQRDEFKKYHHTALGHMKGRLLFNVIDGRS